VWLLDDAQPSWVDDLGTNNGDIYHTCGEWHATDIPGASAQVSGWFIIQSGGTVQTGQFLGGDKCTNSYPVLCGE